MAETRRRPLEENGDENRQGSAPTLLLRLAEAEAEAEAEHRSREKPGDHAAVWIRLKG